MKDRPQTCPNPCEVVFPANILRRLVVEDRSRIRLLEDENAVCPGIRVFRTAHLYPFDFFLFGPGKQDPIGWCRSTEEFYQAANRIREEADIFVPAYAPSIFEKYADGVIVE